jgi:monofunctional biosynthetic peptidoglycan transglycosylase
MLRKIWRFTIRAVLGFFALTVLWVVLYRWVNPPITVLQIIEGREGDRAWCDIDELGSELPLAVMASEDQRFLKHNGFEWGAIERAIEHNKKSKKKRGASTISQQTAKNVFLWPSRSWVRKGLEVYFTFLIETLWPKERIMEVYLNVIEMGPQTFGAHAASQRYFKKVPGKLSRREAALIAACLPQPRKSNPGKPSAYLSGRGEKIQKQMRLIGGPKILPWIEGYVPPKEEAEKETKRETESETETETETAAETEAAAESETEQGTEAEPGAESEPEAEPAPETGGEAEAEGGE